MKKILVRISKLTASQLGATEYTYLVTFPSNPTWAYTIRATEEGWWKTVELWREAGYEVETKEAAS